MDLNKFVIPANEYNTVECWEIPFRHSDLTVHAQVLNALVEVVGQIPLLREEHTDGAYVCFLDENKIAFASMIYRPVTDFSVQIMKNDRYAPLARAVAYWAANWCNRNSNAELL